MEGSSSRENKISQDLAITVFTPPSVLYELMPSRIKVPFKPMRATNNKGEESPPPHDSFQSTALIHYCSPGNTDKEDTEEEKVLAIEKEGRR